MHTTVIKLLETFMSQDAAADVQSQEIITQEVLAFMSKAARTRVQVSTFLPSPIQGIVTLHLSEQVGIWHIPLIQ